MSIQINETKFKVILDQLIKITPEVLHNNLKTCKNLDEVLSIIDEMLVVVSDTKDGLMLHEDKEILDRLAARPELKILTQYKNADPSIFEKIATIDFGELNVISTGLKSVKIEIPSYKYVAKEFKTVHTIVHNLETMDLNVTIRTRNLGEDFYSVCMAKTEFIDKNRIRVTFTRAEEPKIFISKY
jgi:uncharacterized Fe-S cluster-containing radical SAM superfamily protein